MSVIQRVVTIKADEKMRVDLAGTAARPVLAGLVGLSPRPRQAEQPGCTHGFLLRSGLCPPPAGDRGASQGPLNETGVTVRQRLKLLFPEKT